MDAFRGSLRTFVLKEVAHACPSRQHELGHIFNDLRLFLWRESREPFCKSLGRRAPSANVLEDSGGPRDREKLTTLPCLESRIR
jgi:hypothetical protein